MTSEELQTTIKNAVAAVDRMSCNDIKTSMNAGILDRRFKREKHVYPCYDPIDLDVHTYEFANKEFKTSVNMGEITVKDYLEKR